MPRPTEPLAVGGVEVMEGVTLRAVQDRDCEQLWEWVNEPATRRASFDSRRIEWEEHVSWFRRMRADSRSRMYIVCEGGTDVGIVRFDVDDSGVGVVSVSLAADARGRGLGTASLRLACVRLHRETNAVGVLAYIKPDNVSSLRAFARAGFIRVGEARLRQQDAVLLRWSAERSESS